MAIEAGFPERDRAAAADADATAARSAAAARRLTILLRVLFAALTAAAVVYALGPIVGPARSFFHEPVFVSNSVVKVTALAWCCLYASGDVLRRRDLVRLVIAAHVVSVAAMGLMLLFADTGREVDLGPVTASIGTVLWAAIALDGVITGGLFAFDRAVPRAAPEPSPPPDPPARVRGPLPRTGENPLPFLAFAAILLSSGLALRTRVRE